MKSRVDYRVDANGIRCEVFEPGATGLPEAITLTAKLTVKCKVCTAPIAWIFETPHPDYDVPIHCLIRQGTYPPSNLTARDFDRAGDHEQGPIIFPGLIGPDFGTYCGGCRKRRRIKRGPVVHALLTGKGSTHQ